MNSGVPHAVVGRLLRELAPQVLGAVARRHADFADAEDAVQEALAAAAARWPADGVPENPQGWLYRVAVRRLADHVRGEVARRRPAGADQRRRRDQRQQPRPERGRQRHRVADRPGVRRHGEAEPDVGEGRPTLARAVLTRPGEVDSHKH